MKMIDIPYIWQCEVKLVGKKKDAIFRTNIKDSFPYQIEEINSEETKICALNIRKQYEVQSHRGYGGYGFMTRNSTNNFTSNILRTYNDNLYRELHTKSDFPESLNLSQNIINLLPQEITDNKNFQLYNPLTILKFENALRMAQETENFYELLNIKDLPYRFKYDNNPNISNISMDQISEMVSDNRDYCINIIKEKLDSLIIIDGLFFQKTTLPSLMVSSVKTHEYGGLLEYENTITPAWSNYIDKKDEGKNIPFPLIMFDEALSFMKDNVKKLKDNKEKVSKTKNKIGDIFLFDKEEILKHYTPLPLMKFILNSLNLENFNYNIRGSYQNSNEEYIKLQNRFEEVKNDISQENLVFFMEEMKNWIKNAKKEDMYIGDEELKTEYHNIVIEKINNTFYQNEQILNLIMKFDNKPVSKIQNTYSDKKIKNLEFSENSSSLKF